jgi:hypothetical protein
MTNFRSRALACATAFGLVALSGAAHADALATPSIAGPLSANPNPFSVDLPTWFGDAGGKIYIGGDVSGLAYVQSDATHAVPGDEDANIDLSNGQVFIQKTDGWLQFFADVGAYSFPTVGVPYLNMSHTVSSGFAPSGGFGFVPEAYLKIQGEGGLSAFSIEGGKLPTLIGDEYGFTFQNMNIERGLLWNVEPIVSRGAQINYAAGPLTINFAWTDGFYSNTYSDLSGLISYALNSGADTFSFNAEGNIEGAAHLFPKLGIATSLLNDGSIYNLAYTHTSGPWTISPYLQYVTTPKAGAPTAASIWGGAVLVSYSFNDNWKLAARGEYESSSGNPATAYNLLGYGAGSSAWSVTVTPTYQWKVFYARADVSYTGVSGVGPTSLPPGFGFGKAGTATSQVRGVFELGVLF